MSLRRLLPPALLAIAACAPVPRDLPDRREAAPSQLPAMKVFAAPRVSRPARSNRDIAQDFLDLTFQLESGRTLPVFTRFEGPVSLRVTGAIPTSLEQDLTRLLGRIRTEARIDIARVPANRPANITIQTISRRDLQRTVPEAACFVVPRVGSWDEFRANRRNGVTDWTTLETRERLSIFIPGDVPPQELRDCLHEELAQALGPLNDLYRLTDSVFNDDNFHTVLTGFDMLVLRATYAPELRSGMTRDQVAARLPAILSRLNPAGDRRRSADRGATNRAWIDEIERALGPRTSQQARRDAAKRAVAIARASGWRDNRLAFSLFALGRLSLGVEPELALGSFLQAAGIYGADPATQVHEAHIAMQLAAFALSAGEAEQALAIVDANTDAVMAAENAALLATLLLVKAEALELLGRDTEAQRLRLEGLGWARYGFGSDAEVLQREAEISAISPRARKETAS
ncbi:DUF2927 domain-containing protein [Maribius pontilimi]|uniref:DUF2927 domain-containing protein n=1 Tax=Palleronia pontilimi TaxID=1964209 RepID=A0A934IE29_9RHOB|nr:DUF2927 domain-containing protein [Palleronia pontilimi]MBJ3761770.1 DUF2927 domain-containing protein [Palleronia pontilimi]